MKKKSAPKTSLYEQLEDRVLFDAVPDGSLDQLEKLVDEAIHLPESDQEQTVVNPATDLVQHLNSQNRNELVFVDKGVEGYREIVAELVATSKADVVFLNSDSDGVQQIADALAKYEDLDAVHIISHGDQGQLQLGNQWLDSASMQNEHATAMQAFRSALSNDADVLIYGCDVAGGQSGEDFVKSFAEQTGADVAASDDLTGATELGGDWDLEAFVGDIDAQTLKAEGWSGTLAAPAITAPHAVSTEEDVDVTMSGGKKISVASDSTDPLTVTLSVSGATIHLAQTTDLTFLNGTLDGEATLEFSGLLSDINAALDSLMLSPDEDHNGNESLSISVDDGVDTTSDSVSVTIASVNDTPELNVNPVNAGAAGTPSETTSHTFSLADFEAVDPDNTNAQLTFQISSVPTIGSLKLNGYPATVGSVFSQQDLSSGALVYVHNGGEIHSDSFSVTVNDGAGGSVEATAIPITITPINDAMSIDSEVVVYEGGSTDDSPIAPGKPTPIFNLTISDAESDAKTVEITSLPDGGVLLYNGVAVSAGFTFSAADVSGLAFVHDGVDDLGTTTSNRSFDIRVTDAGGGTPTPQVVDRTVNINVISVNDEPTFVSNDTTTHVLNDGVSYVLQASDMVATDADGPDGQLTFFLEASPALGLLYIDGQLAGAGATFTQDDLAAGKVVFANDGNSGLDQLKFTVRDKQISIITDELGTVRTGDHTTPAYTYEMNFELVLSSGGMGGADAEIRLEEGTTTLIHQLDDGDTVEFPSQPTHGLIYLNGTLITPGTTYTVAAGDEFTYEHNGVHIDNDTFGWIKNGNPGTVDVLVFLTNDAPIFTVGMPLTGIHEGSSGAITDAHLVATDEETLIADEVLYTMITPPTSGSLLLDGVAVGNFGTFTHQDVIDGRLSFEHDGGENFIDSITFEVADGSATAINTLPIEIIPVNDTPDVNGSSLALMEGATKAFDGASLNLSDVDGVNDDLPALDPDAPLQVRIDTLPAHGTLLYNNAAVTAGFVLNYADVGSLSYAHDSSENFLDAFNFTAIDNNTYTNGSFDAPGTRGGTMNIAITPVNDAPAVTVNEGFVEAGPTDNRLWEGETRVITSADLLSVDPDSSNEQVQYRVTALPTEGFLLINGVKAAVGSSFTQQQLIDGSIEYAHKGLNTNPDVLSLKVDDGSSNVPVENFHIEFLPINDAPKIAAPGSTVVNSADFHFTGANKVSVSDQDSGTEDVTVTLTVADPTGLLRVTTTAGLTSTAGNDTSNTLVLVGAIADVNAALATLHYRPSDIDGASTLTININDNGNVGTDPSAVPAGKVSGLVDTGTSTDEQDDHVIALMVSSIDDAPVNTVPGPQTTYEDVELTLGAISIADVDAFGENVEVTLAVNDGTLTLASLSGLNITAGANGAASVTVQGTIDSINAALAGITYLSDSNYVGSDTLTITTNDLGNTGDGGPLTDVDTVDITVLPVNDAPTIDGPGSTVIVNSSSFPFNGSNTISVGDVDAATGLATVELTVSDALGTLAVSTTTGLSAVSGNGTSNTLTFSGTIADLNTALASLTYTPGADVDGSATLSVNMNDNGNTGTDPSVIAQPATGTATDEQADATYNLLVSDVDDAPVNTVPGAQTIDEDVEHVISGISIADVDAFGQDVTTTVSVANGTLSAGGTGAQQSALTSMTGDGTGTLVLTGSVAEINAVLSGLSYTSDLHYNGSDTLTIVTNDLGNTGAGGPLDDTDTVDLTIQPVNDAPVNTAPASQNTDEDTDLVFSTANGNAISISDVDVDEGTGLATVTLGITNGTISLNAAGIGALTFATGDGTDDTDMKFTGTLAQVNAALQGLTYTPTSDYNGSASLSINTSDNGNFGSGGTLTDDDSVNITVKAVADVVNDSVTTPEDTDISFDVIAGTNGASADNFEGTPVLTSINGTTVSAGDIVNVANGKVTIDAVTGKLTFAPTLNYNGTTSFTYTVTSPAGVTETATATVVVTPVNDAPVNTVPGAQTIDEDIEHVIPGISIADVDANGSDVTTTVSVANGTLSAGGTGAQQSALTSMTGDGTGTLVLTGSVAEINAVLSGLSYTSDLHYNGSDTLTIVTNDLGNTGAGGPLDDTDTVDLTIQPVNDAPVNTAPASQNTDEDTDLVFSTANGNAISISDVDVDEGTGLATVTLGITNGTISLNAAGIGALTFATGDGTDDTDMKFTGTLAQVNAALQGLTYTPTPDYNGSASLSINTSDNGNFGSGGTLTDDDSVNITVKAVADVVNDSVTTPEDTDISFDVISGTNGASADNFEGTPVLTSINGTTVSAGDIVNVANGKVTIDAVTGKLTFAPTLNYFGTTSFTYTVTSPAGVTETATATVIVTPVNDVPIVDLSDPSDSDRDFNDTFTEGGSAVSIADTDAVVVDVDDSDMDGAKIALTTPQTGDALVVGGTKVTGGETGTISGTSINYTVSSDGYTVTLDGTDTKANYASAIKAIGFINTSPTPNQTDRTITVVVSDDDGDATNYNSNVAVTTISLDLDKADVQWRISGDTSVTEGDAANYTIALSDALLQSGETAHVNVGFAHIDTTNADLTNGSTALNDAITAAVTAYNNGDNPGSLTWNGTTLTFTSDGTGKMADLSVSVATAGDTVYEGDEDFKLILAGAGSTTGENVGIATGGSEVQTTLADNDPVTVTIANASSTEGNSLDFDVTLSNKSVEAIVLNLSTTNVTTEDVDYEQTGFEYSTDGGTTWIDAVSGTQVTIPAGQTAIKVRIETTVDTVDEIDETFTLAVATVTSGTVSNSSDTGTGEILDDDAAPGLSIDDVTRNEATGTMKFTVTLDAASEKPISVNYATVDGTAVAGGDFTGTSGTLNFATGVTSQTITVAITDDSVYETSEDFNVKLTAPVNATISDGTGVGTILDDGTGTGGTDDDRPTVAVGDVTVTEGTDTHAVFTIKLSNASDEAIVLTPSLTSGTATVGTDTGSGLEYFDGTNWVAVAGNVTIPAGQTSLQVRTSVTDDSTDEFDENVAFAVAHVSGTLAPTGNDFNATATIQDNDAAPGVSIDDVTRNEAAGTMTFTVTLDAASEKPISVNYATADGTAIAGSDFTGTSGTLNFATGVTSQTITVNITDDNIYEAIEKFNVNLTAPTNAAITDGSGLATILDDGTGTGGTDDDRPVVSISDATATEGDSLVFEVALSNPSAKDIVLNLATAAISATDGTDYENTGFEYTTDGTTWITAVGGTQVTIPAGSTGIKVRIDSTEDTLAEPSETFRLSIKSIESGTVKSFSDTGVGTITDDDTGLVSVSATTPKAAEPGTDGEFTVTMTNPSSVDTVVAYSIAGTAINGTDNSTLTGKVTILAGETTATIDVPVQDDSLVEGDETVIVTLTTITSGDPQVTIDSAKNSDTVTIADDDSGEWSISGTSNVDESDTASYTVALTGTYQASESVSVNIGLTDVDTTDDDYSTFVDAVQDAVDAYKGDGTLAFDQGTGQLTWTASDDGDTMTDLKIDLPITDDSLIEGAEDFSVGLSGNGSTTGVTTSIGTASVTTTINDDTDAVGAGEDGPAQWSISGTTSVDESGTARYTVALTGTYQADESLSVDVGLTDADTTSDDYATFVDAVQSAVDSYSGDGKLTFNQETGKLTWTANDDGDVMTDLVIDVAITDDSMIEGAEDFSVGLSGNGSTTGITTSIGTSSVTTTINDDTDAVGAGEDGPAQWSISGTSSVDESGTATYSVALTGTYQADESVSVDIGLTDVDTTSADHASFIDAVQDAVDGYIGDGTLTYDEDTGKITWTAEEDGDTMTTFNIDLAITDDSIIEGAEDFKVGLSGNGSTTGITTSIGTSSVTTAINDDSDAVGAGEDGPAQWSISGPDQRNEGTDATYVVELTGKYQAGEQVNVTLSLTDVDTTSSDYGDLTAAIAAAVASNPDLSYDVDTGVLTYTASEDGDEMTRLEFTLPISTDLAHEAPEDFSINLTVPGSSTGISTTVSQTSGSATTTITSPPVADPDVNTTSANSPVDGNVLTNDESSDGSTLTVTEVNGTAIDAPIATTNGSVTMTSDGQYTYTPNEGFTGTDTFTYEVCDENGMCVTETVTIEVRDSEDPTSTNTRPIANDDVGSGHEDQPINGQLLSNDGDPDGESVTVSTTPVVDPVNGTVTINPDGTYTYVPDAGFTGTDTFTYEICDGSGACDTAIVTLSVLPDPTPGENDAPNAHDDAGIGQKNTDVEGDLLANDSDPNGDALTVNTTPVTGPANGTVTINPDGTYTYTPDDDFLGNDSFTYEICDADGVCDVATVSITIFDNPPVAENDFNNTLIDTPISGNVLTNDSDPNPNDTLTVNTTPIAEPAHGSLELNSDGTYTYTPDAEFIGTDSFEYEVCDEGGNCTTAIVEIEVRDTTKPINRVPEPKDDSTSTFTNTPVDGNVLGNDTDPDGDPLTVNTTPVSGPSNGTLTLNSDGSFTYTPTEGFEGTDSFVYEVCDDSGLCETATVEIAVTPDPTPGENDAPIANPDAGTGEENRPITGDLLANDTDPNGDPLEINTTPVTKPENGTLAINPDGTYEYRPDPEFTGTDTFEYEVCDDSGACSTTIVTLTVTAKNVPDAPPIANGETTTTFIDQSVSGSLTSNDGDPEGGSVSINTTPLTPPSNGTIVIHPNGTYTYTPAAGFIGTDTVEYEVCDEAGNCDTAVLTINVFVDPTPGENDAPNAGDDAGIGTVNRPIEGDLLANDTDPNGDALTVNTTPVTEPTNGTLVIHSDGTYTYTPDTDFIGTDSFTYEVCDDSGVCDTATVNLTVFNQPPQAIDDFARTPTGQPVTVPVLENDSDPNGDPLDVMVVSVDQGGTATVNEDGTITFTPDTNFLGTATITYLIEDPHGASSTATITVEVFVPFTWDSNHNFSKDFSLDGDDANPFHRPLLSKQIFTLAPEPIFSGYARPGTQVSGRIYDQAGRLVGEGSANADPGGNWMMQLQGVAKFEHYRIEFDYVVQSADIYGYLGLNPTDNSYSALQPMTGWDEPMSIEGALRNAPSARIAEMHQENNRPQGLGTI